MYWQVKTDHFWWAGLMETEGNAWLGLLPWGMLGWAATGLQLVPSSHPLSILAQQGHCTWGSPFLMALELLGCQGWGNQFGLEGWRAGETLWDSQHPGCTLLQGWTNVLSHSTLLPNVCTLQSKLNNHCQDHLLSNNHFYCFYTFQLGLQLATKKSCGSDSNPLWMKAWEPKPSHKMLRKLVILITKNTPIPPFCSPFLWLSHSWALVEGVIKNHTKQHDRC